MKYIETCILVFILGRTIVRLVGSMETYHGTVELIRDGQVYGVCDNGWKDREAEVICRSLGFE